ncbi:alpha-amylase family glycosyl hydrolase [Hymenobacter aerophilus]|uniref:alpha-amylase family glycosyl hydrolase n=1 Tax=Hymenobacter aerophilus TaxID=119644 RepID=UPI00036EFAFE|nr:alpha-amylase family glycosyl hydrolase [Hymenobacter aerophilus]
MTFFPTTYKNPILLLTAAALLGACRPDVPQPPAPLPPVTTTPPPAQYGTPFAGVPDRQDAAIYQVNMRAFSQAGNFAGVLARIDSIKGLGVNVLYLMPIYPVGSLRGVNSPYAVRDYRAVGAEFGSFDDLRKLVDAAHARQMAVMLDWVANHTAFDHAWVTQHPDWYLRDASGTILSPPNTNYTDVAQLNFSSQPMRLEMIAAMKSWVYTANVDGFRCDYADAPPVDFWQQAVDTLRNIRSHKLLLLAEGTRPGNFTAGFDYNFGFPFYDGLKNVYRNGVAATTFTTLNNTEYVGATGTQQVVRYTTNHDVNGSDGTPITVFGGDAAAMSAFVVASCFKGVPMVYNGQEAGMTTAIPFPFTDVKVRWDARPEITKEYKRLLRARAASAALRHGTPSAYSTADVCAFTKTAGSEQAFVVANVRSVPVQYTVPTALANSAWTDALSGGAYQVGSTISLPAHGYLVLKK